MSQDFVGSFVTAVFAAVLFAVAWAGMDHLEASPAPAAPDRDNETHVDAGPSEKIVDSFNAGYVRHIHPLKDAAPCRRKELELQ